MQKDICRRRMSFLLCSCVFGLILQDPLGDEAVEELDEGPEAERADEGTQTHKTAQKPAEQGAEGVGEDAADEVLENYNYTRFE